MRTERAEQSGRGRQGGGEGAVGVRGGDNRTGEGSGGDAVNADQASSDVTQGQSEAAAEGTHISAQAGGAAYTARKRQKLHHKVCDLCVEVSEVLSSEAFLSEGSQGVAECLRSRPDCKLRLER